MYLSLPTPDTVEALSKYKIIECGAGKGTWLRILRDEGIDAIGVDPDPGEGVSIGDHRYLWCYADRTLLLIVWPPDGTDVSKWIEMWGGDTVAICGCLQRFKCPEIAVEYHEILAAGRKGNSEFILGKVIK